MQLCKELDYISNELSHALEFAVPKQLVSILDMKKICDRLAMTVGLFSEFFKKIDIIHFFENRSDFN